MNRILMYCPRCGNEIIFKTSSGSCDGEEFRIDYVSWKEFKGIIGKEDFCDECGVLITINDRRNIEYDYSFWTNAESCISVR